MKNEYYLIEKPADLDKAAVSLLREKNIAVDLESDSMYHFKEKVCLLQITSNSANFIIDPLKIPDLSPLKDVFADEAIRKIFHGADYDIRSLARDFQFDVHTLFDTQLASRFLGFEETGLEALLQRFFNISLDKRFQKKDWSKRPLPMTMLNYAANDTLYLIPLARILEKKLREKNRLQWVKEECRLLSRVRPSSNNQGPLYLNFKGAGSLKPRNLAVLESLLQMRRHIAERKDKPLFKVLQNSAITKIVRHAPPSKKQLAKLGILSQTQIDMYGDAVICAVKDALTIAPRHLPVYPRRRSPSFRVRDQERIKALKKWKEQKSGELGIEPALILAKPSVTAIALNMPETINDLKKIDALKEWQVKAFGKELLSALKTA
ncbi:MAG: HRDC domain-containing protein [Desulfobacterales bacterium]